MNPRTPGGSVYTRTLARAAESLGGVQPLANPAARPAAGRTHARANPEHSPSGQFRQVQPRDGAPASNKPGEDEKNQAKG